MATVPQEFDVDTTTCAVWVTPEEGAEPTVHLTDCVNPDSLDTLSGVACFCGPLLSARDEEGTSDPDRLNLAARSRDVPEKAHWCLNCLRAAHLHKRLRRNHFERDLLKLAISRCRKPARARRPHQPRRYR